MDIMRKLPPLNALRAFEAAARHMSFAEAAEELRVTPTAISHQVKLLEDTLGQRLFRRQPRPMVLTQSGERLLPTLCKALDDIAQVVADLSEQSPSRSVRVTTTAAFASRVLLPVLPDWANRNPEIELEIQATEKIVDLRAGEADLAVRYGRDPGGQLQSISLGEDVYVPMASPDLINYDTPTTLSAQELLSYPLIEYRWKEPDPIAPTWEKWRAKALVTSTELMCLSKTKTIRLSEESHAIDAAVNGQGVVLASSKITRRLRTEGKLKPISDVTLPGLTYFAVYSPSASDDRLNILSSLAQGIACPNRNIALPSRRKLNFSQPPPDLFEFE